MVPRCPQHAKGGFVQAQGGKFHFPDNSINKLTSKQKFSQFSHESWVIPIEEVLFVSLFLRVRLSNKNDYGKVEFEDQEHLKVGF